MTKLTGIERKVFQYIFDNGVLWWYYSLDVSRALKIKWPLFAYARVSAVFMVDKYNLFETTKENINPKIRRPRTAYRLTGEGYLKMKRLLND